MKPSELTKDEKLQFLEIVKNRTTPIKPHEAQTISAILELNAGQHGWRSQRHVFCEGCRRELTPLDYFLTSLRRHTPAFIRAQVAPETLAVDSERQVIEIVDHPIAVICTNCGIERYLANTAGECIYLYMHPVKPKFGDNPEFSERSITRLSRQNYDSIVGEIRNNTKRQS